MSRFDFNFGAQIQCIDGQNGKLVGLVVNPADWQVTDLIVKKGFLVGKQARLLPLSLVKRVTLENVQLAVHSDEFEHFPQYRQVEYEEPAPTVDQAGGISGGVFSPLGLYGPVEPTVPMVKKKIREGIVPGQRVIEHKMPLKNVEGTIGSLAQVWVDRNSETITQLVVHQGMLFSTEQLVVPMSMVKEINEDDVFISCTHEELAELLHQRSADPV
ncbi:MAG: hypothetical protein AB1801_06130 [Chloroflexota bacterium]